MGKYALIAKEIKLLLIWKNIKSLIRENTQGKIIKRKKKKTEFLIEKYALNAKKIKFVIDRGKISSC